MPGLREPQGMAHVEQALSVRRMRIRGVRHRRHHLSGHSEAAPTLVPIDVVGRRAKERGECRWPEPHVGNRQREDGVDLAAQTAAGDGAAGPRAAHR